MPPPESGSDGENGEKPVRERLKQTTIDKNAVNADKQGDLDILEEKSEPSAPDVMQDADSGAMTPPKSAQKRTLEDAAHADSSPISADQGGKADASDIHTRKRTREDQIEENGEIKQGTTPARDVTPPARDSARLEAILTSPRKKRSRESLGIDEDVRHQKIPSTEGTRARRSSSEERQDGSNKDGSNKVGGNKVPDDDKSDSSEKPVFGEILKPKPVEKSTDKPQTSSSAFAASGFASLSGSASPFGSLGSPDSRSSEASSQPKLSLAASASQPSAFGSSFAGSQLSFASAPTGAVSGFGALGGQSFGGSSGGFGAGGFGGGARLNSFAAPVGDVKLGTAKAEKPFGAPAESDKESESGSDGDEGPTGDDAPNKERKEEEVSSPKFHVQEVQTGEDNEDSVYSNRAKLFQYHADSSSWKERGVGPIKVNVERTMAEAPAESDAAKAEAKADESKTHHVKARFVMRNHATHKVILNAPIYKEMKVDEQSAKQLLFVCPSETGAMTTYMLRMGKEDDIKHLHRVVNDLQDKM